MTEIKNGNEKMIGKIKEFLKENNLFILSSDIYDGAENWSGREYTIYSDLDNTIYIDINDLT
jgi:hypothetical protein